MLFAMAQKSLKYVMQRERSYEQKRIFKIIITYLKNHIVVFHSLFFK